jgi:hypothetical protein
MLTLYFDLFVEKNKMNRIEQAKREACEGAKSAQH